jgi:hypothetical protein
MSAAVGTTITTAPSSTMSVAARPCRPPSLAASHSCIGYRVTARISAQIMRVKNGENTRKHTSTSARISPARMRTSISREAIHPECQIAVKACSWSSLLRLGTANHAINHWFVRCRTIVRTTRTRWQNPRAGLAACSPACRSGPPAGLAEATCSSRLGAILFDEEAPPPHGARRASSWRRRSSGGRCSRAGPGSKIGRPSARSRGNWAITALSWSR